MAVHFSLCLRVQTLLVVIICALCVTAFRNDAGETISSVGFAQRQLLAQLREKAESGMTLAYFDICKLLLNIGLQAPAAGVCEKFITLQSELTTPKEDATLREAYRYWGEALRETGRYVQAAKAYAVAFKAGDHLAAPGLVLSLTWTARFDAAARVLAAVARQLPPGQRVRVQLCVGV